MHGNNNGAKETFAYPWWRFHADGTDDHHVYSLADCQCYIHGLPFPADKLWHADPGAIHAAGIARIEDIEQALKEENHQKLEGYWHKFSNIVMYNMLLQAVGK